MFLPYFSLSFVLHFVAGHPRKTVIALALGLVIRYGFWLWGNTVSP